MTSHVENLDIFSLEMKSKVPIATGTENFEHFQNHQKNTVFLYQITDSTKKVVEKNDFFHFHPFLKSRSNTIQLKIAKLFGFQFESCVNDRDSSQNSLYLRLNSFVLGPKAQEKIRSINIKPTIIFEDTFLKYSQFVPYFEQKVQNLMIFKTQIFVQL